jgi:hypothetical protein
MTSLRILTSENAILILDPVIASLRSDLVLSALNLAREFIDREEQLMSAFRTARS